MTHLYPVVQATVLNLRTYCMQDDRDDAHRLLAQLPTDHPLARPLHLSLDGEYAEASQALTDAYAAMS